MSKSRRPRTFVPGEFVRYEGKVAKVDSRYLKAGKWRYVISVCGVIVRNDVKGEEIDGRLQTSD